MDNFSKNNLFLSILESLKENNRDLFYPNNNFTHPSTCKHSHNNKSNTKSQLTTSYKIENKLTHTQKKNQIN